MVLFYRIRDSICCFHNDVAYQMESLVVFITRISLDVNILFLDIGLYRVDYLENFYPHKRFYKIKTIRMTSKERDKSLLSVRMINYTTTTAKAVVMRGRGQIEACFNN
ncbi:hypothetical protein [Duncaniella muris]|uniref:hypothetical protein n=1 Tax=Duncaniella muris TaxID=2094150 RepID=UPI0025B2860E|nr:hypothetical protein [Duncaniella muris]